jgi:hypothetical protein
MAADIKHISEVEGKPYTSSLKGLGHEIEFKILDKNEQL